MSAHQGDSSPDVFVFPPFAPPGARPEPAAPPAAPEPSATPPAPAEPGPEPEPFGLEVSLPAHDIGDPDAEAPAAGRAENLPWEFPGDAGPSTGAAPAEPAPSGAQDLPWLELPEGTQPLDPGVDAPDEVAAAASAPDAPPTWMAWDTDASSVGSTAAEITPPPLATAGELTSVSAVPSPAAEVPPELPPEPAAPAASTGFAAPDPYAPRTEALHPETLPRAEGVEPAHSWPVEAMEPAALQAAEAAPAVAVPVAPDAVAVHAPAVDHAEFGRVAERLEAIASALRNDPGGFVAAHQDDPLALLVAGFVLGYRQAAPKP